MSNLRSFVVLQARLYEFLEQQDETTLQALASGAVKLAVLRAEDAQTLVNAVHRKDVDNSTRRAVLPAMAPSRDPAQAAQDLSGLTTEQERQLYLNAAALPVQKLQKVAKLRGLAGYSRLTRSKLIDLLVGVDPDQIDALATEPKTTTPSRPLSANGPSEAEQQATAQELPPATAPPAETARSNTDMTTIASHLRETETEEEGATYLHALHLDREGLLAVAAELQLTRVSRLSQTELEKRVLKQAIGARRKFAGLRRW